MSGNSAVAKILAAIPDGMVRRAAAPFEKRPGLKSGIGELDRVLGGGWARGKLNILEAGASASTGRTAIAYATAAAVTGHGYTAAWVDGDGSLDPVTLQESGANMKRLLWVRGPLSGERTMKASHEIITSGLFELLVIRPSREGGTGSSAMQWARLSRETEITGTTVLVIDRGGFGAVRGAVSASFEPLESMWVGQWGPWGYLDGAAVLARTDAPGVIPEQVRIDSKAGYGFMAGYGNCL